MINNSEDILKYENNNKMYIPTNYKNSNYVYKINGDYITIITNNNCSTQYQSTYCNCYQYNYKNNVISEVYSCNTSNNNPTISYQLITDDLNYSDVVRERFMQDKTIAILIFIIGILLAIFLTKERKSL